MIVAFAGQIGSGKSELSKALAEHYGVPLVSFGDAVRQEASRRGLAETRTALQDLGDQLISAGWDQFCRIVFDQIEDEAGGSVVVDGVRHLGAIEVLRTRAIPSRLYVVFVVTPETRRQARLIDRGLSPAEALAADQSGNEGELISVKLRADLVISNDEDIAQVVGSIARAIDEAGGMD